MNGGVGGQKNVETIEDILSSTWILPLHSHIDTLFILLEFSEVFDVVDHFLLLSFLDSCATILPSHLTDFFSFSLVIPLSLTNL